MPNEDRRDLRWHFAFRSFDYSEIRGGYWGGRGNHLYIRLSHAAVLKN